MPLGDGTTVPLLRTICGRNLSVFGWPARTVSQRTLTSKLTMSVRMMSPPTREMSVASTAGLLASLLTVKNGDAIGLLPCATGHWGCPWAGGGFVIGHGVVSDAHDVRLIPQRRIGSVTSAGLLNA